MSEHEGKGASAGARVASASSQGVEYDDSRDAVRNSQNRLLSMARATAAGSTALSPRASVALTAQQWRAVARIVSLGVKFMPSHYRADLEHAFAAMRIIDKTLKEESARRVQYEAILANKALRK